VLHGPSQSLVNLQIHSIQPWKVIRNSGTSVHSVRSASSTCTVYSFVLSGLNHQVTPQSRFIVMASSNEYARKILNSPQYAEPCIVASGRQILSPGNWYQFPIFLCLLLLTFIHRRVFLTGKKHVDYRRPLNCLFTRKALGSVSPISASTKYPFKKSSQNVPRNPRRHHP
jgi:hypothetical protein